MVVFAAMHMGWLDVQGIVAAKIGIRALCHDVPPDLCQDTVNVDEFLFLHFLTTAPQKADHCTGK
jgi:hypothetical protein